MAESHVLRVTLGLVEGHAIHRLGLDARTTFEDRALVDGGELRTAGERRERSSEHTAQPQLALHRVSFAGTSSVTGPVSAPLRRASRRYVLDRATRSGTDR